MNCAFCASGLHGFVRNLTAAEILAQLYFFQSGLQPQGERVSRVVVMGSGEPMLNLDNVLKALDILHSDRGQCIGYRNMTVSTCGVVPGIEELTAQGRNINLAISSRGFPGTAEPIDAHQPEISLSGSDPGGRCV